ncbi:MAG TPA: glycoside hydrolase family 2 protein [Armatimonadota bacterium]|jgi:beta-mannosidase
MSKSNRTESVCISTGWRVTEIPQPDTSPATALPWLPATVPGHVHIDLVRAGVIGDPFYRMMERSAGWVDEADWVYEIEFPVDDPTGHRVLRFNGLDTVADITLNGEPLGHADNMLVEHEFPVDGLLRKGPNALNVTIHSALRVGRRRREQWVADGNDTLTPDWFLWGPRSFVRKAQYMYGWDWGPEPVSCGIWKSVELVTAPVARLLDWRHAVEFLSDGAAHVDFEFFVERAPESADQPLTLAARLENGAETSADVPPGEGRVRVALSLDIADAERWRPNGAGPRKLHELDLALTAGEELVDARKEVIGLRAIELIREPDADGKGESFKFRVNGEDLFIRGANWIPADSFASRLETPEGGARIAALVERAAAAGINMLRVWGGGLYESDAFYNACDRLGILVWQDFPYACAYYPDTDEYADAARDEAVKAVRRLRNHPSLAIWCGNNENSMMHHYRWGGENTPARYLGEPIYNEVLPQVLSQEDPARPYWPSSPFGGDPNSEEFGDRHDWDVWHMKGDWVHYVEDHSRFVSEFGFASSCGLAAWNSCLEPSDRSPRSAAVRWHDKTRKGYDTYLGYVALHFPEPQTLEDLVYYSQCNQALALSCGVEHWRRSKGHCWGTIFWQFNDCWPVQSWSVVDAAGEPKAAWYAAKRFYAPVLLSLVRDGDIVRAHVTNDTGEPVKGKVTLRLESFKGEYLERSDAVAYVKPNSSAEVDALNIVPAEGREDEVYVYARFRPDGGAAPIETFHLLAEPKDLRMAAPCVSVDVRQTAGDGSFEVTVSAKRFAPFVWLRLTGETAGTPGGDWSDNYFHLRAGKSKTVTLRRSGDVQTVADVLARLAIRTL